ncbi:cyclic nucleotide-binding domain-containing protein [Butyrivibrio sp. AE2032]|uniref:cyclic nucleotide-binding domain-containing protein n=1 Tax=Butyrivibrio sp. AE2032 TaxID=1458463 RepID=UPI00068CF6F2|nr:cyclic nucleotide-binding domain-containing protein [Butyrivibrio sp. AE2032]
MGLLKLEKGQIFHKAGTDIVETVEVLVKGRVRISSTYSSIILNVGAFIGAVETPGQPYSYTYEALEESAVYSYPYESRDDIAKVVKSSPKIAPVLAATSAESAATVCAIYDTEFDEALKEYEQIVADYADYPALCIKVGEVPKEFPEMEELIPPERSSKVPQWAIEFSDSLKANEATLKKSYYPLSTEIATGMVMTTYFIYDTISTEVQALTVYRKTLKKKTSNFTSTMKMIRARLNDMERAEAGEGEGIVTIVNALSTILAYSGVPAETATLFEEQIAAFKANDNRYDSSDEARALRRNIGSTFYQIYTPAFLRSLTDENIPLEVKMFFMFGFVDEELAGEKNTAILANMVKAYTPDPEGHVLTLYEWLQKIYLIEVEPSRNEFDQDWPTYLREQKNTGAINNEQMEAMNRSSKHRLEFEIHNLFALGNRMTFGRISSFVPVFDSQNVLRPLDMAYLTASKVKEYYEKIRSIDYGVFCRQAVFSDTEIGITQLYFADDITPYMILMPNVGSRACLWQEIEGKNRRTKARMLVSIFNTENTEEAMFRLFGEFRWEMCKTEQGVHWNDVTDPSLTSMYCDYLQFFKKNSALSSEQKEKLRTDLKKYSNNYKNVFIADYLAYIKYESAGSPRLNKVAREILFTFCPFGKEVRDRIGENPQYTELINHYRVHIGNQAKPIQNIIAKLNKEEIEIPEEVTNQLEHLKK